MAESRSPLWNGGFSATGFNDESYGRRLQLILNSGARYFQADPESIVDLAASSLSDQEMLDVFHRSMGQAGILAIRDKFESMPSLWQEGEFARLNRATQHLLQATGYRIPADVERDTGNIIDRIFAWEFPIIERVIPDDLSTPGRAALFLPRAIGKAIGTPVGAAWRGLNRFWGGVRHVGNTMLAMDERHPSVGTVGVPVIPLSTSWFDPSEWLDAWNDTADENDSYTNSALAEAEDLIGPERVAMIRVLLRDGVEGVSKRFEEIGAERGMSRDQIANALVRWYDELSNPAEQAAMEILETNRRDLPGSIVASYNRTSPLPDVRPGTVPATVIGGSGALMVEIALDPFTWVGTGWVKGIKAARAGLRPGTTREQIQYWQRVTAFFRETSKGTRKKWAEAVEADEGLAQFVGTVGASVVGKTFMNIRAQANAMNRFIARINDTFKFLDEYDDTLNAVRREWHAEGRTGSLTEELEEEVFARMGVSANPVEQLLRDIPALGDVWDYMYKWHRGERAKVAVVGVAGEEGGGQLRMLSGTGTPVSNVKVGDEIIEVLDEPLGDAVFAIRTPMPTLTSPEGYWRFITESEQGYSTLAELGTDATGVFLPRITQFGRAWVWGKKMVNKPIDFLNVSTETTAELARLVTDHIADEFNLVVARIMEGTVGNPKLSGRIKIDEDMVSRIIQNPTEATAADLGLSSEDFAEVMRLHDNASHLVRQEMLDDGMLSDFLDWYKANDYRILESTKEGVRPSVSLPGGPFASGRRVYRNYYDSRIHAPGSTNDTLTWLERAGLIGRSAAMGFAYYPAKYARKLTTYVPRRGYMDVLDKEAVSEFTRLVEMGALAHMPRATIDNFIRIFATGNEAQRWLVQTEFLMDFLGRSGALVNGGKHVEEFVKRFLQHADARYSFLSDDVVGFKGMNMRRAIIPGAEHGGELSRLNVIPNYRELSGLARQLSFYRKIGWGLWMPQIDNVFARTWKPAVLLRLGYVARNGGEELFSWLLREGPQSYVNHRLARTALDMHVTWDEYGRKVLTEVAPEQQRALVMRPVLRVWRSINELAGYGDFSVTLKAIRRAMLDPDNKNRWMFMSPAERQAAFKTAHAQEVADMNKHFFASLLRGGFEFADMMAQRTGAAIHGLMQRIPEKGMLANLPKTRAELAERVGTRIDRDHAERVRMVRASMTVPTVMDAYMKNVLSTFDTYTNFEGARLDSALRKAGFGTATQDILRLPIAYDKMRMTQVVNRPNDANWFDKTIAVTQRLTYMGDDPASRGALFELAHYVSDTQDAIGGPMDTLMKRLLELDPELATERVIGRGAVAEHVIDAAPGAEIGQLHLWLVPGKNRARIQYDARVRTAREEGHEVVEVITDHSPAEVEDVRRAPMKQRDHLRRVVSGNQTSDTRLATHWPDGVPETGSVVRFHDADGNEIYARIIRVRTVQKTRRQMAWVRQRSRETPTVDIGQRAPQGEYEVHWIDNGADARGEVDWASVEVGDLPGTVDPATGELVTPETGSVRQPVHPEELGFRKQMWSRDIEDNAEFIHRNYRAEGFDTPAEYAEHLRKLRQSRERIIQVEFEPIDSIQRVNTSILQGGTEQAQVVVPAKPAVQPMGPSQFVYEWFEENAPWFLEALGAKIDEIHAGTAVSHHIDDETITHFVHGIDDEFAAIIENLLSGFEGEEIVHALRDFFLPGVVDRATGRIVETGRLSERLVAFLTTPINPSRLTNDWDEILKRMEGAYRAGLASPDGQQFARSSARSNIGYGSGGGRVSDPLPEGYSRVFIPMVPMEYRSRLVQILSGTSESDVGRMVWVEEFQRRLEDAFRTAGRNHNPSVVSHLIHPHYGPDANTALSYFRISQQWADSGAAHFPVVVGTTDPEVAQIVSDVLNQMLHPEGMPVKGRIGSVNVNSETLYNMPGAAVADRALHTPPLDVEISRGGVVETTTHAELATPFGSQPFYGWTERGAVSALDFEGGRGLANEYAFGVSSHLLTPGVDGVEQLRYVDNVPQIERIATYRNKRDGRVVQLTEADQRPKEWYDGDDWELTSDQFVTGDSLIDWINDMAARNIPEIRHLMAGVSQGVREVQSPWLREVLLSSKARDIHAQQVMLGGDWDRAPRNLLAIQPVTDEAGKKWENPKKFWQSLVGNWFDGVVNPLITSIVREPMYQSYFIQAMQEMRSVRRVFDLPSEKTDELMELFRGVGKLDDDGQFFLPILEDFIELKWPSLNEESPVALRTLAAVIENENSIGLRDWARDMLKAQRASGPPNEYTRTFERLAAIGENPDKATAFFHWAKNRRVRLEKHIQIAAQRAMKLTGGYIDDHRIRSQFQEMVGTLLPFWFAEDNFLRRMGRGLKQNPLMVRNLHLTMQAGVYGGLIQEDTQGNKWFVYPGSEIATTYMLEIADRFPIVNKIVGGGLGAVANQPLATSLNILPGYDAERIGQPGFGPLLAVPVNWMAQRDPAIRSMYEKNLIGARFGSERASDVLLGPMVPAVLARSVQLLGINWPDSRARDKATIDVMKMLAIKDQLPEQDSIVALEQPELFEEQFLAKVDAMALQYQILQGLTWFGGFSTGVFSELVLNEGWEWSTEFHELLEAGVPYEEAYPKWVERIESQTGEEFDPMKYSPFVASASTKRTFAVLESTREANEWLLTHENFVDDYGLSAAFFMPRSIDVEDDRYSAEAKQRAINYGLRDYKTPAEFLSELYYQAAYPEYHIQRTRHLHRKYALKKAGLDTQPEERRWDAWLDTWSRRNPVFASRIASGDAQLRREKTIEEFRQLLARPSLIPDGPHVQDFKEAMRTIVEVADMYEALKNVRTTSAQQKRDALRFVSHRFMERFIDGRPWLNEMYYSVFLPLLGDTWLAKAEAGIVDVPRLAA